MGQWPSKNFIDVMDTAASIMANRYSIGNFRDKNAMGFLNQIKISGQKTVQTKADLSYIPANLLSSNSDNYSSYPDSSKPDAVVDGSDALGQLWWVQDEKCFYQLVKWGSNAPTDNVWAKANIKSAVVDDKGNVTIETTKVNTDDGKNSYWITSFEIRGDGTYSYTKDTLHIEENKESDNTYSNTSSTQEFEVLDNIKWNPSNTKPFNLTYSHRKVKVLSQAHHDGSFEGDFLTSASLSSTGTLSGTTGKFSNKNINDTFVTRILPGHIDKDGTIFPGTQYLDTEALIYSNGLPMLSGPSILSYAYIDSTGKLITYYGVARNWLHDKINTYNDANKAWFTYYANGKEYIGYFSVASVSGKDLNSYEYTAGIINDDLMKRYESKINDISNSYNNLSSYVKSSYSYLNDYLDNTITYLQNKSAENNTYLKDYVDNNALVNSIASYSGPASTYIAYNVNNKYLVTYMEPASSTNQGPLSAYTYSFFEDYIKDIEERLHPKEVSYSTALTKLYTIKYNVYRADDKTKLITTYDSTASSITVEEGNYVEATNITNTWVGGNGMMIPTSTSGSWGNKFGTDVIVNKTDPSKPNYFTAKTLNWTLRQVTSAVNLGITQTLVGISKYGAKKLVTKDGHIEKYEPVNTLGSVSGTSFSISVKGPQYDCWYGFTDQDPLTWANNQDITDLLINTIEKETCDGKSCFTKMQHTGGYINIQDKSPIALKNTTLGNPKYFIYIYNGTQKVTKAIQGGATPVTGAFRMSEQKTVIIKSRTNGYPKKYTVLRCTDNNQTDFSGTNLEFKYN